MNYNEFCSNLVSEVTDSVGAAIVDLNSGLLMGVHHTVPYFTQAYLDAVAAAAVDMFRGKNITRVETLLSKQRGDANHVRTMEEVHMSTIKTFHFMKVVPGKDLLVVLITKKTSNMGMGWSAVRMAVSDIS